MTMQSGNFGPLLEPGLRRVFDLAMESPAPMVETLYGSAASTKLEEHYQAIGELGEVPPFDGTVQYETFDAGYTTDIRNYELAKGIYVQRALLDDDQYGQINRKAARLGNAFANTIEVDAVQTFINAFTDSGTNRLGASTNGADGVALCSTAHPRSPVNTGQTQSNEGTLALTLANWDTTRQNMLNFTDDKGNLLDVAPDTILVPTELERTANQIFGRAASYEPGSAEFNVNLFNGRVRVLVWNRLTDANAWFAINSRLMKEHLIWQWRIRPEFAQASDFDGIGVKYRGYMRYGIGFSDWRWIYGQNPS